jgi:hypothetical protein
MGRGIPFDNCNADHPEGWGPFRTDAYFLPAARFEALSGLSFCVCSTTLRCRCVAKLQVPRAHFVEGLGATAQKVPSSEVTVLEQPSHCSTTAWQRPPLKLQPFLVMNAHSIPFFKVMHCIVIFLRGIFGTGGRIRSVSYLKKIIMTPRFKSASDFCSGRK